MSGTPEYLSPEMLNNETHSYESDIWGFGCFIFELVFSFKIGEWSPSFLKR